MCFGAFVGQELYACAVYGVGVNMAAETYLAKVTGLAVKKDNLYELKRLARIGARGESRISLTRFLAICHRILLKEHGIQYIYSFSDPEHSHDGTIYRAANFIHLGQTDKETHFKTPEGKFIHRRVPYRLMQHKNVLRVQETETRKTLWEQACEDERKLNDEKRALGRPWPKITDEIKARQAKKILQEDGQQVYTLAQARSHLRLIKHKSQAKDRWFLPLVGRDRNALLETLNKR